jgi:hypothetical protein
MNIIFDNLMQYDLEEIFPHTQKYHNYILSFYTFEPGHNYITYDYESDIIKFFKVEKIMKLSLNESGKYKYYLINSVHNFDYLTFYQIYYDFICNYLTNNYFIDFDYKYICWEKKSNATYVIFSSIIDPMPLNKILFDINKTNITEYRQILNKITNCEKKYNIMVYCKL